MSEQKNKQFSFITKDVEDAIQYFNSEKLIEMFIEATTTTYQRLCELTDNYPDDDREFGRYLTDKLIVPLSPYSFDTYYVPTLARENVKLHVTSMSKYDNRFAITLRSESYDGKTINIVRNWTATEFTDAERWMKEAWDCMRCYRSHLLYTIEQAKETLSKLLKIERD